MDKNGIAEYFDEIFEAFSHTADGKYVYICDIEKDLSYWSKEAVEYFGLPGEKMYKADEIWLSHIEPESREYYVKNIGEVFAGITDVHDLIYRAANKNGEYVTCSCKGRLIRDKEGKPKFFAGTIVNHELDYVIDPVTGLYGRKNLMDRLRSLAHEKKPYYMLITGISNFFDVNSTYGYNFGNKVLKSIAEKFLHIRKNGTVFRSDGTKMVLVMPMDGHDINEVSEIYDELRRFLQNGLVVDDVHLVVNIVGAVITMQDFAMDVSTLYNSALHAVSNAKDNNVSELNVYRNGLFNDDTKRVRLLSTIRNSIINDCRGFYLCYQPIVDAHTEKVVGMEALLRWKNEEYGIVPPDTFIPWLERDPVFYELGNWILTQAMSDAKKVISVGDYDDFKVNVNLAYPQLQRSEFKADIAKLVERADFPAQSLKLELTERCKLLDMDRLRNDMIFFRTCGYETALDDFGTGYSALNLLAELPVDQIKIDRSFVLDIENDSSKQSLLRAITKCAGELGKKVCIEGIENENMRDYLKTNFNVDNFQGYYYSRPVVINDFMDFIKQYDK